METKISKISRNKNKKQVKTLKDDVLDQDYSEKLADNEEKDKTVREIYLTNKKPLEEKEREGFNGQIRKWKRRALFNLGIIFIILAIFAYYVIKTENYQYVEKTAEVNECPSIAALKSELNCDNNFIFSENVKKSEEVVQKSNDISSGGEEIKKEQKNETQNKAEVSILVLNGGAPSGTAGKLKDLIVSDGYKNVSADNAKLRNYQGIEVYYKEKYQNTAEELVKLIENKFNKGIKIKKADASVEGENKADIVVVAGS